MNITPSLDEVLPTLKSFLQNTWENAGFEELTAIQLDAAHFIIEEKDIIAYSPAGRDKTLAYLLPLLRQIDSPQKHTQVCS